MGSSYLNDDCDEDGDVELDDVDDEKATDSFKQGYAIMKQLDADKRSTTDYDLVMAELALNVGNLTGEENLYDECVELLEKVKAQGELPEKFAVVLADLQGEE